MRGTSTAYSYDRADRITAAGATAYMVNTAGNLTARGSDSFSYDQANRLTGATVAGTTTTYAYDGDGIRVMRTQGATTNYVHDRANGLPTVIDDGNRRYVQGPAGLAYSLAGSALSVHHADALGSARALSDSTGAITQRYGRDAWGTSTATQGSSTQPFGFTGELNDASTGLLHLRARDYDPATGRFMQRDAVQGSTKSPGTLNRYAYANNNPVRYTDPNGHCGVLIGACVGALVGAAAYLVWTPPDRRTDSGFLAAIAGGAVAGQIGMMSAPIAGAIGLSGVGGTAVVSGLASATGYTVQAALDPAITWSPYIAVASAGVGYAVAPVGLAAAGVFGENTAAALVTSGVTEAFAQLQVQSMIEGVTSPSGETMAASEYSTYATTYSVVEASGGGNDMIMN